VQVHRVASWVAQRALGSPRRGRGRRDGSGTVVIVLLHAYGMSGASVFNLAEELARTRDVEIVSVVRQWKDPRLPLPHGVRVTWLDDRRSAERTGRLGRGLSRLP